MVGPASEGDHLASAMPRCRFPRDLSRVRYVSLGHPPTICITGLAESEGSAPGRAAWDAINASAYDLLITDSNMPEVDGYELIRLMRSSELSRCRRVPILVLSASTTADHMDRYATVGADEVVVKPITLEKLKKLTSKYLDK